MHLDGTRDDTALRASGCTHLKPPPVTAEGSPTGTPIDRPSQGDPGCAVNRLPLALQSPAPDTGSHCPEGGCLRNENVRLLAAPVLGGALGVLASVSNALTDPLGQSLSYVMNAGWAWAGVAVAAGWVAATCLRGAIAGVVAQMAAALGYYVSDSMIHGWPFVNQLREITYWFATALVFGALLGLVGAFGRRRGVVGLLGRLVVPLGAVVEMVWPIRWPDVSDPTLLHVRVVVGVLALTSIGVIVLRYLRRGNREHSLGGHRSMVSR